MLMRRMSPEQPGISELIGWFSDYSAMNGPRCLDMLRANFDHALQIRLDAKQLDLVLYQTSKAINEGAYGEDDHQKDLARRVVDNYIQRWSDRFMRAFSKHAATGKNGLSFKIAEVCHAFSNLKLQPPERLSDFLQEWALAHMQAFNASDLTRMMSALGSLALPLRDDFQVALVNKAQASISGYEPDEALEVLHAMAVINSVQKVHKPSKKGPFKAGFDRMMADPRMTGEHGKVTRSIVSASAERRLLDTVFWFNGQNLKQKYPECRNRSSGFESDVRAVFERSGAEIRNSVAHPITGKIPDLTFTFNGKPCVLECEGPTHFLRRSDDHYYVLNGNTIFQRALDIKREPDITVLSLPYDVFYGRHHDRDPWDTALLEMAGAPTGLYTIDASGQLSPLHQGYDPKLVYETPS